MFGLMEDDGVEWKEQSKFPLFEFVKNGWSGMENNETYSIPFYNLLQIFIHPNLEGIQWNENS